MLRQLYILCGFICLGNSPVLSQSPSPSSYPATVSVHLDQRIGAISPYIYGQYLEHVQRDDQCIYPSLWDNQSPFADKSGLRRDVIAAARELGVPVVRWPGGCFADVYDWEDGIGPQSERPVRINKHWGGEEPNHFGTDEFLRWCQLVGTEAYINANLGTGTLDDCLNWLEYCNGNTSTPQGKRRKANGHSKPYDVAFWGIGNETFAKWEAGYMDAKTYAATLTEWAGAVRQQSPKTKIMAVGSMSADVPEWDRALLDQAGHLFDYLTFHAYGVCNGNRADYESVAFTPVYFEQRLRKMIAVLDEFAWKRTNQEPIRISMDEWNIRHHRDGGLTRKDPRTQQDAVFAAGVLNTMIRLSPRVGMANYVFLVNGNGVMLVNSNQVVKTPLFHLFKQYGEWMQGDALNATVNSPMIQPPTPSAHYPNYKFPADFKSPESPYLDVTAALKDRNTLAVAIVNRHGHSSANVELDLPKGFVPQTVWTLHHEDIFAANSFDAPDRVSPTVRQLNGNKWSSPPHSVSIILCKRSGGFF
ncbi:MAG: alpha-N-arabinofuranosidase [Verrucomicrobia bacterium]|nr:alpha-N-arabinofuranosidase [Verrucomicrobiota bacterium]